jgi:hypothetical protein
MRRKCREVAVLMLDVVERVVHVDEPLCGDLPVTERQPGGPSPDRRSTAPGTPVCSSRSARRRLGRRPHLRSPRDLEATRAFAEHVFHQGPENWNRTVAVPPAGNGFRFDGVAVTVPVIGFPPPFGAVMLPSASVGTAAGAAEDGRHGQDQPGHHDSNPDPSGRRHHVSPAVWPHLARSFLG